MLIKKIIRVTFILFGLLLILPGLLMAEIAPGTVINKGNIDQYKQYLPNFMQQYIKDGWGFSKPLEFKVMAPEKVHVSEAFLKASMKNKGKLSIGPDGALEGDYMAGLPFPELLEKQPDEIKDFAVKAMYNQNYRFRGDDLYCFYPSTSKRKGGMLRSMMNFYAELVVSGRTAIAPVPEIPNDLGLRRVRFLNSMTPPNTDFKTLEWRFKDPRKADQLWAYIPTLRRTLRMFSNERTNPIRGSVFAYEDAGGFDGIPYEFNFKLLGAKDLLACMHQKTKAQDYPNGFTDALLPDDRELVKSFLIEITAKDKRHPASKRLVWLESQTFNIMYMELYDKRGEIWKVLEEPMGNITTVDGTLASFPSSMCGSDVKTGYYSVLLFDRPQYNAGVKLDGLFPNVFYQYTGYGKDLW